VSFTPDQAELIAHPGHALALAGPGSGKTSTVIEKIARLLQHPGNSVVACTFSREGAEEIRRRLTKRIGEAAMQAADIRIGTFHALIADHRKKFGRGGRTLSPAHQLRTLATAAAEHGLPLNAAMPLFEEIKYSLVPPSADSLPPWFHSYENHLRTINSIDLQDLIRLTVYQMALSVTLPDFDPQANPDDLDMPQKLALAASRYRTDLRERCTDLKARSHKAHEAGHIHDANELRSQLQSVIHNEGALPLLGATHLIIDESQDNDQLQFALATLHAMSGVPTTLIGDDDQTIYEWRQAMGYPGLMSFASTFDAKLITLGANFRSLRTIVESAEKLIKHNDGHRIEKVFESRRGAGGSVIADRLDSEKDMILEASNIIDEMAGEATDPAGRWIKSVPTGEFGVLARNNSVLDSMEKVLSFAGIKYSRMGGSLMGREAAQFIYGILGGIYAADINGISVMLQIMGVNTSNADKVCRSIKGREADFVDGRMVSFDAFGSNAEQVETCAQWFMKQRDTGRTGDHTSVITEVCEWVSSVYGVEGTSYGKNKQNYESISAVRASLKRMKGPVLQRVARLRDADTSEDQDNAVALMTFHGSKGLEFKSVVILAADDKSTPGKGELMSERRLFYVAVTRAKNSVVALYSGKPSRYLSEMDAA
jgi:superfamily I DNA/RNA helicase